MPTTDVNLDSLITRTDAVAEAISAGDWQRASQLEVERRQLLERYLEAESRAHGGLEHIRDQLTELVNRNNQFAGEVHHERRRILREASMMKRGRAAAAVYDREQRDGAGPKIGETPRDNR